MCLNIENSTVLGDYLSGRLAYPYECTLFSPICLTAKALRSTIMCGFSIGAIEPEPIVGTLGETQSQKSSTKDSKIIV